MAGDAVHGETLVEVEVGGVDRQLVRPSLRPSLRRLLPISAVFFALLMVFGASPVSAHTGDQSYIYLDVTEQSLTGRLELPMVAIRAVLDLDLDGSDEERLQEFEQNLPAIHQYADDHFDIGANGSDWDVTFGDPEIFFSDEPEVDDNYLILPFQVDVADAEVPRLFDVRFDAFFDEEAAEDALLLIANDWQTGIIENGREDLATFDGGTRDQTIDLGDPSRFKNFTSSMKLGVKHIQTGPDHILFVLVLLLPSVLVFSSGVWRPTNGFLPALWRVLKIVTMFTVAHSITFTLAGLGLVPLPSPRIVESVIALSIAAAALHNLRPVVANKEWLISFVFGLFHGLGFASLVSGLDVSRGTQLVSLLGRNVGIEIGQAIVVLLLFPALFILRRTNLYRPFFIAVSVLLIVVSLGWMVERAFETDLGISAYVDPVFEFPRILIYIAGFSAACVGYFFYSKSKGTLSEPSVDDVTDDLVDDVTDDLVDDVTDDLVDDVADELMGSE